MDDIAIRVDGLGKRFRLRHTGGGPRYRTLREDLLELPRRLVAKLSDRREEREEFWALKDVSFEVKRGEVLGIIGRNGAGKSTLLKILSRIMDPTCGEAIVQGRIGSLLEVGTGFHPELTGRENIFLSGALLGMRRNEVRRRFDEIVSFAGVEKFLDTPCKHYSSGMYARLGFAVAAHLDAEILLVDEVLAVGDAEFQKQCFTKIESVANSLGRTVLFVSHNNAAVRQLCSRGVYLNSGRRVADGPVNEIIERYTAEQGALETQLTRELAPGRICGVESIRLEGERAADLAGFVFGQPIKLSIEVTATRPMRKIEVAVRISTREGIPILTTANFDVPRHISGLPSGRFCFCATIPPIFAPGQYKLTIALCDPQRELFDIVEDQVGFSIDPVGSLQMALNDGRQGSIELTIPWECTVLK